MTQELRDEVERPASMDTTAEDYFRAIKRAEKAESSLAEREEEIGRLKDQLLDCVAHLVGAASAYRKYASRSRTLRPRAEADPMFTTRASDFERAAERASTRARALASSDKGKAGGEEGWAVAIDGKIDVRTVSPTERAAKVNGIVVLCGLAVSQAWTDEAINRTWIGERPHNSSLVRVRVSPLPAPPSEGA